MSEKKERLISKISVNAAGLKGLILEGSQESLKNNKLVINGYKDTVRHPIHSALESAIEDLRFHVLDICGLYNDNLGLRKDEKHTLREGCEILSVEFQRGMDGWFKIQASSRVFDTKFQKITTPKINSEDGYEHFDTVMKVIDLIVEEIGHYVNKTKVISDEELAIAYIRHGKGGNIDMEALNEMSVEEKTKYIEEISHKLGFITNVTPMEEEEFEEEEIDEEAKFPVEGDDHKSDSEEKPEEPEFEALLMEPRLYIEPLELEPLPKKQLKNK